MTINKGERMIRVLHYIGSLHYAGAQTFLMELYRNIDKEKVQFDFVVSPEEKSGFYQDVLKLGGRIFVCPRYKIYNHLFFKNWWRDFWSDRHDSYDIFHVHVSATASIAMAEAERYGVKRVLHSHSNSNGTGLLAKLKDYMQKNVCKHSDYMFACSDEAGKYLFGNDVLRKNNYETLPNAVNIDRFVFSEPDRKQVRSALEIEDKFVVGLVGRFHPLKNHSFALDLLPELKKNCPNVVLLFVGDGKERTTIENKIKDLKVADSVILVGNKQNTEAYYSAMDLFLLPSKYEGFGIVALEAQISGLTCIVSRTVPPSVNVSGKVVFVDLKQELWIEEIEKHYQDKRTKCNILDRMYASGFSSAQLAKHVENVYRKLLKIQ